MKFKPVTDKYSFDDSLVHYYPEYLQVPLKSWIKKVLIIYGIWIDSYGNGYLTEAFINDISLHFREQFPSQAEWFLNFIFEDTERVTNILGLCLQNYAFLGEANELEKILSVGGSAFAVMVDSSRPMNDPGISDLIVRVPSIVLQTSEDALSNESLIKDAWQACYSRNPDYDKTVSKSVDALEGLLRDKHFPLDKKPVLTKFINDFVANPNVLYYKGNSLIKPKNALTDLGKEFITIRGQHTSGTGRQPTKEEAEFVLHYVIFFWNLYR